MDEIELGLQGLLDKYELSLPESNTSFLNYLEHCWEGNEDVECILELARILKFMNLCGQGNKYKIQSTISVDEFGKQKGWGESVEFQSEGVYRIIYNELSEKLGWWHDFNIFSRELDGEKIDDNDEYYTEEEEWEDLSEFQRVYGKSIIYPNKELDIIIEEYKFRNEIRADANARLGMLASTIYQFLKDKNNVTKTKFFSFIYELVVLLGIANGKEGVDKRERYQYVKNWITAYNTYKEKIKPLVQKRLGEG